MVTNQQNSRLNEVKFLKNLDHPNIIKFYEAFKFKNFLGIVLEYADGEDLQTMIKKQKSKGRYFAENHIWSIAYQLCSGLLYLKSKNLIHRDIKALNIYCFSNGTIKIGDFSEAVMMNSKLFTLAK